MSDKTRNYHTVNLAIDKALEDNPLAHLEYNADRDIVVDGTLSLAELKAVIAAIESVPLE